jgi:hypothetical protein
MPTFTVRLDDAPFAILHGLAKISGVTAADTFRAALTQKIGVLIESGNLDSHVAQQHQEINAEAASLKALIGLADDTSGTRLDVLIAQQHEKLDAFVAVLRAFVANV